RNRRGADVGIDVENRLRDGAAYVERGGRRLARRIGNTALAEMRPIGADHHQLALLAAAGLADGAADQRNLRRAELVAAGPARQAQRGEATDAILFDTKGVRFHAAFPRER